MKQFDNVFSNEKVTTMLTQLTWSHYLLLNNFYMRVPCFLVKGIAGRLQHTWNEVLLEDGTTMDLDISKQSNRIASDHSEFISFDNLPKINTPVFKK